MQVDFHHGQLIIIGTDKICFFDARRTLDRSLFPQLHTLAVATQQVVFDRELDPNAIRLAKSAGLLSVIANQANEPQRRYHWLPLDDSVQRVFHLRRQRDTQWQVESAPQAFVADANKEIRSVKLNTVSETGLLLGNACGSCI